MEFLENSIFFHKVDKGMRDVLQSDELFDCKQVNTNNLMILFRHTVKEMVSF